MGKCMIRCVLGWCAAARPALCVFSASELTRNQRNPAVGGRGGGDDEEDRGRDPETAEGAGPAAVQVHGAGGDRGAARGGRAHGLQDFLGRRHRRLRQRHLRQRQPLLRRHSLRHISLLRSHHLEYTQPSVTERPRPRPKRRTRAPYAWPMAVWSAVSQQSGPWLVPWLLSKAPYGRPLWHFFLFYF